MNYSSSCSIPSAKDVIEHPLTLFIDSVTNCDKSLMSRLTNDNAASFVAAFLRSARKAKEDDDLLAVKKAVSTFLSEHSDDIILSDLLGEALSAICNVKINKIRDLDIYMIALANN